jgi:hypothetical protein
MINMNPPALPRGFELTGDPAHDREEEMWAGCQGGGTVPVGTRAAYDEWARRTVIAVPKGWTLTACWTTGGQPALTLRSPRTNRPVRDDHYRDDGTQQVWQEVSATWVGGDLHVYQAGVVTPERLHQYARTCRSLVESPARQRAAKQAEAARQQVREWYRAGLLGRYPQSREAGDWLDAIYVWRWMPRPLCAVERTRMTEGLRYLAERGLEEYAERIFDLPGGGGNLSGWMGKPTGGEER